jgi:hypothetical protein
MADQDQIDRAAPRRNVRMAARCRSATGLSDEGWLEDISAEGCCLVSRAIAFRVGSRIVIRPEGLEGITGVVRWTSATRAGIEFDSPLYGPTVEHLWAMFGDQQTVGFSAG